MHIHIIIIYRHSRINKCLNYIYGVLRADVIRILVSIFYRNDPSYVQREQIKSRSSAAKTFVHVRYVTTLWGRREENVFLRCIMLYLHTYPTVCDVCVLVYVEKMFFNRLFGRLSYYCKIYIRDLGTLCKEWLFIYILYTVA